MAGRLTRLWQRLGLPRFWSTPASPELPDPRVVGRTGDARFVPQMTKVSRDKTGRELRIAHRFDDVSINDYDKARFYPIVRDGLRTLRAPLTRANAHFQCQDQLIADLCTQELGPLIPELVDTLIKGSTEFGWQVVEKRWAPKFDVEVSVGGQQGGSHSERVFPFIWTIARFASFSPRDTRILIDPMNGNFGGVRQFIRARAEHTDIHARKCIHFVYDREFDGNYGVPLTKSAIPFIDAAESVYDSMTLYAQLFASPYKVGRYPGGRIALKNAEGATSLIEHASLMDDMVTGLEAGHSVVLPSDTYDGTDVYKWDLQILEAPGGQAGYVDQLNHLNDMIRIALTVPQYVGSSTPDAGTYNLGSASINLFLQNAEQLLEKLASCLTNQLVKDFVTFNFGHDAPRCRLVFEPLDQDVNKMLLLSLLKMLSLGQPLQDADGNMLYPDWGKIAQDKGVPLIQTEPALLAEMIARQATEQLRKYESGPSPAEGGNVEAPDLSREHYEHEIESQKPRIYPPGTVRSDS